MDLFYTTLFLMEPIKFLITPDVAENLGKIATSAKVVEGCDHRGRSTKEKLMSRVEFISL